MNNLCSPPATLCRYCATRKLARACAIRCLSKLSVAKSLTNRFLARAKAFNKIISRFVSARLWLTSPSPTWLVVCVSRWSHFTHLAIFVWHAWLTLTSTARKCTKTKTKFQMNWEEQQQQQWDSAALFNEFVVDSQNNESVHTIAEMVSSVWKCLDEWQCVAPTRTHENTLALSALLVGSQWNNTTTRARRQEKKSSACVPRNYGWCSSSLSFAVTATDDDAPSRRIAACFQPTNFAVTWFIAKNRRTMQENETCRLSLFSVSFVIALVAFFRDFFPFAVSVILCSFTVAACLVVRRYFWFTFHVQHSPFHREKKNRTVFPCLLLTTKRKKWMRLMESRTTRLRFSFQIIPKAEKRMIVRKSRGTTRHTNLLRSTLTATTRERSHIDVPHGTVPLAGKKTTWNFNYCNSSRNRCAGVVFCRLAARVVCRRPAKHSLKTYIYLFVSWFFHFEFSSFAIREARNS